MLAGLRVTPGDAPDLAARGAGDHLGLEGKDAARAVVADNIGRLRTLQNRLWAEHRRALLLVLQGMDAGGKDGTIRRVFRGVNPQGCRVASFRVPTHLERDHDYLWRVHSACPRRGEIGIFNRSHYEDVVTVRVLGGDDDPTRALRFRQINDFERMLTEEGTRIVKVFLHISKDEQRRRLQRRLDDPEKAWKLDPSDFEARGRWSDYQHAYEDAIVATSTDPAPWWVVPADHKWVRDVAVSTLLVETLDDMDPRMPEAHEEFRGLAVE